MVPIIERPMPLSKYGLKCPYLMTPTRIVIHNTANDASAQNEVAPSGSKEPSSALESRRVTLGAHWVDSRESSLLRRLERGREIGL